MKTFDLLVKINKEEEKYLFKVIYNYKNIYVGRTYYAYFTGFFVKEKIFKTFKRYKVIYSDRKVIK